MGTIKPDDVYCRFSPEDLKEISNKTPNELMALHPDWTAPFIYTAKLLNVANIDAPPQIVFDECLGTSPESYLKDKLKASFMCVYSSSLKGTQDPQLLNWIRNMGVRLFVTADREFASIIRYEQSKNKSPLSLMFIKPATYRSFHQKCRQEAEKMARTINLAIIDKYNHDHEM